MHDPHPTTDPRLNPRLEAPVFVYGTARSGTTLTYSLLMASGQLPIYEAESRILECASRYGSLRSRQNQRRFLRDFLDSRQFARSGLSREEMVALVETGPASYAGLLELFMSTICRAQGKRRWAEKSPNNTHFVQNLARHFPDARFIHAIRDGRAVVTSQRKLGWGGKYARDPRSQLIWIGSVWDYQVRSGRWGATLGDDRYLEIRYEDLVRDTPGTLERISRFTGMEIDISAVDVSHVGALGGSNTAFEMAKGGVSTSSLDRWRSILTPEETTLLNWHLGDRLKELGYEAPDWTPPAPPSLRDRVTRGLSRWALRGKHGLNLHTPLGRVARKPLEIGLQ